MLGHARWLCCELCKNCSTDRSAFYVVDSDRPKEAQVQSYLPCGSTPICIHGRAQIIRATWRIWLNRPSSAVMHTYVNLLWTVVFCLHNDCSSVLFLSLSPFISILCHSDWLFHRRSCPRLDVVYPGRAWSSSPACTWHCSLHYFFLQAIPLFPHGVTIVC